MASSTESCISSAWGAKKLIAVLAVFALLMIPHPLFDTDFGWHLRTGEGIVARKAVPEDCWFSFTCPGFPWIAHSWVQDVVVYLAWQAAGGVGVRLWYAFLGLFFIFVFLKYLAPPEIPPSLKNLTMLLLALFLVVEHMWRPQMATLVGFSLCMVCLRCFEKCRNRRLFSFLPLLFLVWANLHGGFAAGLAFLALVGISDIAKVVLCSRPSRQRLFGSYVIPERTLSPIEARVLLRWTGGSFLATFINPYGLRLYDEVLRTIADPWGKNLIKEWRPPDPMEPVGQLFYAVAVLVVLTVLLRRLRLDLRDVLLLVLLFFAGASTKRNTIFFEIYALTLLASLSTEVGRNVQRLFEFLEKVLLLPVMAVLVIYLIAAPSLGISPKDRMLYRYYPLRAWEATHEKLEGKRFYHTLDWGGFLVWLAPQTKIFIDGRMVHWNSSGCRIFRDYIAIRDLKPGWEGLLDSYGIEAHLIKVSWKLAEALRSKPLEWKEIYRDEVAAVFVRKK